MAKSQDWREKCRCRSHRRMVTIGRRQLVGLDKINSVHYRITLRCASLMKSASLGMPTITATHESSKIDCSELCVSSAEQGDKDCTKKYACSKANNVLNSRFSRAQAIRFQVEGRLSIMTVDRGIWLSAYMRDSPMISSPTLCWCRDVKVPCFKWATV
jgi:hypothetical protein